MALVDYHVHTPLCNHARGAMEAYIKQGIEIGLKEMCFLDHLTLRPDGSSLSMSPKEVPLYYQAARKLGRKYEGRIQVKVGMEVDFDPETVEQAKAIVDSFAFDAIGGSIHFLGEWNMVSHRQRDLCPFNDGDAMYASYLDHVETMVEHAFFDFVCHLDVVGKFGDQPCDPLEQQWERLARKIARKGLVAEINTSGLRNPVEQVYPDPWLLGLLHKEGVKITLGSDAHAPSQVGGYFDLALRLAKKAGYTSLATFTRRRQGSEALDP